MRWPQGSAHTKVVSGKGWKDWRSDDRYVYIGLPGYGDGLKMTGEPSWDGAPFGKPWRLANAKKGSPEHLNDAWRAKYWEYLVQRISVEPVFAGAVAALHGKNLVCWCKGKPLRSEKRFGYAEKFCHGDLLAECAERLYHGMGL